MSRPLNALRPARPPARATVFRPRPLVLALALAAGPAAMPSQAQPTGATAIHGTASLSQQGQKLVVTTTNGAGTSHSAINWQSFSIPGGTTTHFAQPSAASTSINRVVGPDPSAIFGTLSSNGRLVLVNPAGITVGAGAVVDTAAFTASTLRMTDADALAGRLRFADGGGALQVDGHILARQGDVFLIAPNVQAGAQAQVESPHGATVLAAGQKVELTGRGLEGIRFEVQAPADQAVNLGTLRGDAVGVFAGTLRHSGLVQAQAVSTEGGRVVLRAVDQALVAGHVRAQGTAGAGGQVDVLGDKVGLLAGSLVDTSNVAGGGQVRVGGDYQGQNPDVQNAEVTYVDRQAQLRANATQEGDGGRVIVWADDTARVHGSIEARAGAQGGDGGFVETSGKRHLDAQPALVDTSAAAGRTGTWLLDPSNITITAAGPDTNLTSAPNLGAAATGDSVISAATLQSAINGHANVVISTTSGHTSPGNITFDTTSGGITISKTSAASTTLDLNANGGIYFSGPNLTHIHTNTGSGNLTINLNAGSGTIQSSGPTRFNSFGGGNSVTVNVPTGKTWTNSGVMTLDLNARVMLASTAILNNTGTITGAMGSMGTISGGTLNSSGTVSLSQGHLNVNTLNVTGGSFTFDGETFSASSMTASGTSFDVTTSSSDVDLNLTSAMNMTGAVRLESQSGRVFLNRDVKAASIDIYAASNVHGQNLDTRPVSSGPGGSVTVIAGTDVQFTGIDSSGGPVPGADGGDVTILAGDALHIVDAIRTTGAAGATNGAGGNGGNVYLSAGAGGIDLLGSPSGFAIDTSGGAGGSALSGQAGRGGDAGSVSLVASSPYSVVDVPIRARGGNGGAGFSLASGGDGGWGGVIVISQADGSNLGLETVVDARGGQAGTGPNGNGVAGDAGVFVTAGGTIDVGAALDVNALWHNSADVVVHTGVPVRVGASLLNSGTVYLASGSSIALGTFSPAMTSFTAGGQYLDNYGVLGGHGNVQADVYNAGSIRPGGHGVGQLTITGSLHQETTGALEFDVQSGSTPFIAGQNYDRLVVTGDLLMDGHVLVHSYIPSYSYTYSGTSTANYELMHAGTASGSGFVLVSGPADLLSLSRMKVGGTLQEIPGGKVSQLVAAVAQLMPGVSVSEIQELLTESFNNSISSDALPGRQQDETTGDVGIVVTDASCKPS